MGGEGVEGEAATREAVTGADRKKEKDGQSLALSQDYVWHI